jgi:hypothetical protein
MKSSIIQNLTFIRLCFTFCWNSRQINVSHTSESRHVSYFTCKNSSSMKSPHEPKFLELVLDKNQLTRAKHLKTVFTQLLVFMRAFFQNNAQGIVSNFSFICIPPKLFAIVFGMPKLSVHPFAVPIKSIPKFVMEPYIL